MAYASGNHTTHIALGGRISALIASFADARAERKVYASTYRELNALTNRELADVGLNRSMIKSVALDAARDR